MQIDERLQQGISAHRSGNLEAALSAYKDVLSRRSCPLLQDDIIGPVLLARIKVMH